MFSHKNIISNSIMAACLTRNNGSNYIALYELDENRSLWSFKLHTAIRNGIKIKTINLSVGTLIILIEAYGRNYDEHIIIYHLDDNQYFQRIQKILSVPVDDVTVWSNENYIFLATLCVTLEKNKNTLCPIYMWKGTHFDAIQFLPTSNAKKIILFELHGKSFIGIINNGNKQGDPKQFTEIFQYSGQKLFFQSIQRIKSIGATDIIFFKIKIEVGNENFLLITNIVNYDYKGGRSTESVSIVYKYDQKFIPFQKFHLKGLKKWVLIEESDTTYLVAITKVSINAYAYDGWRFLITNVDHLKDEIGCIESYLQPIRIADINDDIKRKTTTVDKFDGVALEWTTSLMNQLLLSRSNFKQIFERFRRISGTISKQVRSITHLDKAIIEKISFTDFSTNNYKYMDILQLMDMGIQTTSLLQIIQTTFQLMVTYQDLLKLPKLTICNLEIKSVNKTTFNNVQIDNLNNCNVHDFQNETMYLYIPQLTVKELRCKTLNQLVTLNLKDEIIKLLLENGIIINGDLHIQNDLTIQGAIDGINFSPNILILKYGDQKLIGKVKITNLKTKLLDANEINAYKGQILENKFTKLVVRRLDVKKMFGHINIHNLNNNILKLEGNQKLRAGLTLTNFVANTMYTDKFSVNDFVDVENREYFIFEDLLIDDAEFVSLQINQHLNNIFVNNGRLDILEKSSNEQASISGKTFNNVVLMKPINLQGHIIKPNFNDTNLSMVIEKPVILQGNYTILGRMFVEKSMAANIVPIKKISKSS